MSWKDTWPVFAHIAGGFVQLFFALWSTSAHAQIIDDKEPTPADMVYSMKSGQCYTFGARAAWGAASHFAGAPRKFKYISAAELQDAFEAGAPSNEGILLAEQLPQDERAEMEFAAGFGWETADQWINQKLAWPGSSKATALFHQLCMQGVK